MREITREKILSSLYAIDIYKNISKENSIKIDDIKKFLLNDKDDIFFFDNIFLGILKEYKEIDKTIDKYLQLPWSLSQLGVLEKNILRMAIYEYYYYNSKIEKGNIATPIIISNSLKLSDKYIDQKHTRFIHGILSAIFNEKTPPCKDTVKKEDKNYKGSSIKNINIFNAKIKKSKSKNE